MQIAPVHYLNTTPRMDYLVIVRVEPPGRVDRLRVSPEFKVEVERHDGRSHTYQLDAGQAEDLVHGLAHLAARRDTEPTTGTSPVRFDIELGIEGNVVRLHAMALPEDEAVMGVVNFVHQAFDGSSTSLRARRQPATEDA
jgi:hypothetical protein